MNAHEWNLICIFVSSDRLAGWALSRVHMAEAGRARVDHDFYQLWQLDDHSGSGIFSYRQPDLASAPARFCATDEPRKAARFPDGQKRGSGLRGRPSPPPPRPSKRSTFKFQPER